MLGPNGDQIAIDMARECRPANQYDIARGVSGDPHGPVEHDDVAGGRRAGTTAPPAITTWSVAADAVRRRARGSEGGQQRGDRRGDSLERGHLTLLAARVKANVA